MRTGFRKNEYLLVFLAAVALSFLIFGNGIKGGFVFDDAAVIEKRGDLKDVGNFFKLFALPYHQNMPKSGLYRPVTMASYMANYAITGQSPAGFHVVNILIHALNVLLVFGLVLFLFDNKKLAYLSALLFLFHPIHTEAVTSIVGRAELVAFFFSLLTLYLFSRNKLILSAFAFLLALWSKESAVAILPLIFWVGWLKMGFKPPVLLKKFLVYILPLGIYFILRYIALGKYFLSAGTTTIVENQLKFANFGERLATASKVLFMYFEKLIWPVRLSADYSYNTIKTVSWPFLSIETLLGLLIFSVMVVLMIHPKTRKSIWGFNSAFFLLPYLLVSNLIFPVGTIMGERLMYFPSIGFAIATAYLLLVFHDRFEKKSAAGIAWLVLVVLIVFWSVRTIVRNRDWLSNENLFSAALEVSRDGLITHTSLAAINIRAGRWDEAEKELKIAQSIYPDNSHEQNLLGIVAEQKGDLRMAEEKFKRSIELNTDAINAYINLGKLYLKQSKYNEASRNFLKVIEFSPVEEYVLRYIYARIAAGDPDSAIRAADKYFGGRINNPDLNVAVGTAYFVKKDYARALEYLNQAGDLSKQQPEIDQMIEISRGFLSQ